jgi:hypothetical protein
MKRFDDMTTLLQAASDDAPPSGIDLSEVLRTGHRRRRLRALAPAVTATLVMAVVAGVIAAVTSGPPSPVPAATTQFPLDHRLFGLDETLGMPLVEVTLRPGSQSLLYDDSMGNPIYVTIYAPGVADDSMGLGDRFVDSPPVFGRPATYIYSEPGEAPPAVRFQWEPGAWASLGHRWYRGEPDLATLAGSLRTDVNEVLRIPFTVSPPPSLHLADVILRTSHESGVSAVLEFTLDEPGTRNDRAADVNVYVFQLRGASLPPYAGGAGGDSPNTTQGGRPARVQQEGEAYHVHLLDEPNVVVGAWTGDTERFSAEETNALALSIRTLGSWDDTSQWTEHPIQP